MIDFLEFGLSFSLKVLNLFMIYSGFGLITFLIWFTTWLLFANSGWIFDKIDQRSLMYINLFATNAILNFIVGSFLEKKRKEAIQYPKLAEESFFNWELPSTLFFINVKWWSLVFLLMIIYFLQYGYVPVMTDRI